MPKNPNLKKVLVIGSGPIVIGQAAEFDYAGTQACTALREEGIEVILVNSNPATIMTDKEVADKIYIEPLTVEFLEKIIEKERPDHLIAGMGGQTGLNLSVDLDKAGVLQKYGVKVIGTSIASIEEAEDREKFRSLMQKINQPVIESEIVTTMEEGIEFAQQIGYPVVVRPAYTLGGTGGGIAETEEELKTILSTGLDLSPVHQVLLEKSIKGWKEVEYEVIRDGAGNCITVCNMENIDPVGVHTGDSIVVAPSQTLSDVEYQMLRTAAITIINALDIQGGCNCQFALHAESREYCVIEVNPRVSRSSALASKATGYPIAKVAAKIAMGYNLDEIPNAVTGKTLACFEPTLDYVVTKIPKWPFDKFTTAKKELGTKMMATGEIMAIGNNFESSFLKGIRSLEIGQFTLDREKFRDVSTEELKEKVKRPDDERIFQLTELLRRGVGIDELHEITMVDEWFLEKFKSMVALEEKVKTTTLDSLDYDFLKELKKKGFSDKGLSLMLNCSPIDVFEKRKALGIMASYKMVDTCGGEFDAVSPYYYSTYDEVDEVEVSNKRKIMIMGSGPIRIGQGIEFDYCSVHGVLALRNEGIETIIVNNNPETVSTDFDIADKLYFEPITEEDVLNIIEKEKPEGLVLQFGGQTAIKLANFFDQLGIKIFGTEPKYVDAAEDREKFDAILESIDIHRPKGKGIFSVEEGLQVAEELGYPVLVRPSYVLGGLGMHIVYNENEIIPLLKENLARDKKYPVLIDKYMIGREIEVDAICDGQDILIPGIMEHLERAGVHSGDSISLYPARSLSAEMKFRIVEQTRKLAKALHVIGMINVQYVEYNDDLYVIEVNPRSSRTVPYISKVTGIPMIALATKVMLGEKLSNLGYGTGLYPEGNIIAVKVPVFSMEKLPETEVSLGPEMKSTGEVLGVSTDFYEALYKGLLAAKVKVPKLRGNILATISHQDQDEFIEIAKEYHLLGYTFYATEGTAKALNRNGIPAITLSKIGEEGLSVLDMVRKDKIDMIINTPSKGKNAMTDGFKIRRAAVERNVTCFTSLDTAKYMLQVIKKRIRHEECEIINLGQK